MKNKKLLASLLLVAALVVGLGQAAAAERLGPGVVPPEAEGRFAEQRETIAGQRAELRRIVAAAREKMRLINQKMPELRRSRDFATWRAVLELKQDNLRVRMAILEVRMDKLATWQRIAAALEAGDSDAVEAGLEQVIEYNAQLIELGLEGLGNLDAILALLS